MSTRMLVVAVCVVATVVAAAWWWQGRHREAPPAGPGDNGGAAADHSPEHVAELLQRLNIGVGHLENDQLDDAVSDFTQLAEEVPGEVAAVRNLMIARVLNLAKLEAASPARPTAIEQAGATLEQLRALQPDAVATHVLAARLAAAQENTTAALQELQQATAIEPQDLPAWYEQYSLARYSTNAEIQQQGDAALARAFELAPTNLVVLLERLQAQVDDQDADIVQTLQAGEPRWEQLAPGLQSRVRVDINELVAEAVRAATDGDWPLVRRNVLIIKNVVTPEEATRTDRRQVDRHPLEFVVDRLSEPLMTRAATTRSATSSATPEFAPAEGAGQLPAEGTVTAVVAADFDLNTVVDVALLHADRLEIHRREQDGWALLFSHPLTGPTDGMIAVDLDDDVRQQVEADEAATEAGHPECHQADLDFVLWGPSGVVALQNVEADAQRRLEPIELPAGLASLQNVRQVIPGDLDMDGDLDLLVLTDAGVQLWGNLGDLQFDASVLRLAGLPEQAVFTAALPIDWDEDLDLDVVVADDAGRLSLLESLRHGEFQWRDLGIDTGMSVSAIEPLDRDGAWDLLLAGDNGLQRVTSSRPVNGRVEVSAPQTLTETPLTSLHLVDLNNDGPLDVVGLSSEGVVVLTGQLDTTFSSTSQQVTPGAQAGSLNHLAVADIDGDGRLDLLAATESGARLLSNRTEPVGEWITVSVLAEQIKGGDLSASGRVNHYGIGSLLELRSGAHRQRQIVRGPVVHFGLGPDGKADTVRVLWTNGVPENVIEPPPRAFICERQTLKGSCPYLYAWNGEEFAFVTDLLWAAPIGLTDASGAVVPPRAWEHLIIRPDQLAVREGKYELRLTEELWEAAYFDSVQLTAVDHPEGVEVITNEKVGPPALAEHRLHTISQRRLPVSAVDQQGRDVRDLIRAADEEYVKLFDHKLRQGYTEPTTLELDLGDLSGAEQITLFLTGWIYPTDTTINVALSQNPSLDGPQPLSLAVPDADGQWQTVMPFTGFPGGKTKTIAIDLSGAFLTDDHRVRLSTSQELYWDAIAFTVDESPVELRETPLPLLRAELRSRGVSAPIAHPQHGPERYDYNRVLPSPWRPMDGAFTRLGDVRDLLSEDDNRLLVMGSGDEVVLEFEAPPPPPAGWSRSFVIRNVGWDKDADLHTIYGQTVEPLPLVHMSHYPPPPDEMPTDSDYEKYLRQYQTRRMSP